ncbi:hypothetical protein JJJ17_07725 [Paracoccus caeni]|uniref:Uncharacterized protein n=1 Tax=Paracoccus caeni TaxID=657651 RepID=A0A934SIK6_9RHOB|nr:hypothetical protein [Paracoccus caeni]MBK4215809.1 hypothetical protein [Paracoccus caeni]
MEPQESISGAETIVPTLRGKWMATATMVIHGEAAVLQWQAFLAQMQGRIGTTLVPCHTWFRPKDRNGHSLPLEDMADLSDAQTWEHFGMENSEIVRIRTAAAAPLRATRMDLELVNSTGLRPGQVFSIGERLHRVQLHWQPTSTTHRIQFEPPLRQAVPSGARLEIEHPVCKMRFTTETEGLFNQDYADFGPKIDISFQEAI